MLTDMTAIFSDKALFLTTAVLETLHDKLQKRQKVTSQVL